MSEKQGAGEPKFDPPPTFKCACPQHHDAYECIRSRYPGSYEPEPCSCSCHDKWNAWLEDEDDEWY